MMIDSFSGAVVDLPKTRRTDADILATLAKSPRVSVWDLSSIDWLRLGVESLERRGLIKNTDEPYPWCRYELTEAGQKELCS